MSPAIDLQTVQNLESKAFRAWPALESRQVGGWIQRLSGGYTKRANSINALAPEAPFSKKMKDELETPYIERGLPPIWRLSPLAPAGVDQSLAAAGYRRIDESLVQRALLHDGFAAAPEVRIHPAASPQWLAGFA